MNPENRTAASVIPPCILIVAVTYGFARYSFGLFLPEIRNEMNMTIAEAGMLVSISYLGYLFASVIASVLSGRLGPRLPVAVGGFIATWGLLVASLAADRTMLLIGMFAAGMSPGLSYPPLSDAITRMVSNIDRDWIYTSVNSGTSIGIIISAPTALLFIADWRMCLFVFAVVSLVATVWNWTIMPVGPFTDNPLRAQWPITLPWLFNRPSLPLFASAFLFGVSSSIYWVFATELLVNFEGQSKFFITMFWLAIGLAGLLGAFAGKLLSYFGLRRAVILGLVCYALSLAVFVLMSSFDIFVFVSAALFGATFITITGMYGVWSMTVFPERPSAGFGTVFFLISIGQFIAPVVGGYYARQFGIEALFIVAVIVGLSCLGFLPRRHQRMPVCNNKANAGTI